MDSFYFIFSKFKKLKSKKGFLSFNFYLSISLITFSLISIILTDSFTQGYKNEIFTKLSSLNPDFKITNISKEKLFFSDYGLLKNDLSLIQEEIFYTPYLEKIAIIFSEKQISSDSTQSYKQREGVYVFGIENSFLSDNFLINKYFKNQNFIFSNNSIIIGEYLSKKIDKSINDKIDLLFFDSSSKGFIAKRFTIENIYKTQTQNDEFLVYVPISALQDLDSSFYCHGVIGDFLDKNKVGSIELSDHNFMVEDWDSKNILKFLNSFDVPVKLLMWILMFLSVYSLSSLIFNFLIEKKEDLKILYLMGYTRKRLRYLVVSISLYISAISIFIGISISSLVIYIQNEFKIIVLPSERIFQLTFLPAHFDIFYFIKYPIFLILFTITISFFIFNRNFKVYLK